MYYIPEDQWSCKRSPDLDSFTFKPMADIDVRGACLIWTPGAQLAGIMKETTKHYYI